MGLSKEHDKYRHTGGGSGTSSAPGAPAEPQRDISRLVRELQSFLSPYLGTPISGKFDKRTNDDLIKFVDLGEIDVNAHDRSVWAAFKQLDEDPNYFSNNPAETAQNIGELRSILHSRGTPAVHEPEQQGIRELVISGMKIGDQVIDSVTLPIPLMLRSENDFDMVVKSLILDKYYGKSPAFPSYDQYPADAVQAALAGLRAAVPGGFDKWAEEHPDQRSLAMNAKSFMDERIQRMLQRYSSAAQAKSTRVTWEQFVGMNFSDLISVVSQRDPNFANDMKWMIRNYLADNNYLDSSGQFVTLNQAQWGGFKSRMDATLHNLLRTRGWTDQQLAQITQQVRDVGTSTPPAPPATAPVGTQPPPPTNPS